MYTGEELKEKLLADYQPHLDRSGVSGERLASRLAKISKIGSSINQGSNRIGFSKEELAAKQLVKEWMEDAGLTIREDGAGNVFGRYEGKNSSEASVLSGSHLDSVPNGGHFDGPLGVLSALEVVEAWKSEGYQPDCPFEVVIFTDEEGGRFNGGLMGSQAMAGEVNHADMVDLMDIYGKSFNQVLTDIGLTSEGFFKSQRPFPSIKAYVEVHIEQGKRLEHQNLPVGIVTGIAGPCWLEATFLGESGHAGNTPMTDRHDPLIAASEWIQMIPRLAKNVSSTAVATVGKCDISPNAVNVIAGEVKLFVDIRDIHEQSRDQLVDLIYQSGRDIARRHEVVFNAKETHRITPVPINEEMITLLEDAFRCDQLTPFHLISGAAHDAMILGHYLPSAMIFVKSRYGISHTPEEWSALNDCVTAVHVLKNYLERLTNEKVVLIRKGE